VPLNGDQWDDHFQRVLRGLMAGRVVPLLGAGVNRCGRPEGAKWRKPTYLPDGGELADHLAERVAFPDRPTTDLVRVSQYFAVMDGEGPLYTELREVLDGDYPPTAVHEYLAALPDARARCDKANPPGLIITTNYDDLLERALREEGVPFDLVSYQAAGKLSGSFLHYRDGEAPVAIEVPNEYRALEPAKQLVVLKIHGAIDREDEDRDSYVITEDDYIDYLAQVEPSSLLPASVLGFLNRCHFLFLGYSLRDWNLRVILNKIWDSQRVGYTHWAIQRRPASVDRRFWARRDVEILDVRIEDYVEELRRRMP
jgi:hypothetical protein